MTNLECLRNLPIDELAEWLDEHGQFDNSPWANWFNENYCEKCESITCKVEAANVGLTPLYPEQEEDFAYCELHKNCKFFKHLETVPDVTDIIKMWLESEVE